MDDSIAIKVAGALKGVVRVSSLAAATGELRAECSRLLGLSDAASVKLIAGGRTLQDDAKPLQEYNITAASRVLVTKGAAAATTLAGEASRAAAEDARSAQLDRLKAALDKMAARDGRGLTDKFEFSLENQAGTRLAVSDSDRRALVMGLALHEHGKASMAAGQLQDALGELLLAEESFALADSSLLEGVDNLAMLLLDIVWCCYKLKDIRRLGVCSERLSSARRMLERAHGPHLERLRQLHGNFSPEQATYVRLELLEGVVAFHSGEAAAARQHLQAAQARWQRLQLSEGALLQLAEMGYSHTESCRALRFSGGDLAAAVIFLTEQREKQQERKSERKRQRSWQQERGRYGRTPRGKKYVDLDSLDQLCQLGYDRALAAEALRQAENDAQAALDVLSDPIKQGALQLGLIAQQMLEAECGPQHVNAKYVRALIEMGFREKASRKALAAAGDKLEEALQQLQVMGEEVREPADDAANTESNAAKQPTDPGTATGSSKAAAGEAGSSSARTGGAEAAAAADPEQQAAGSSSSSCSEDDAEMEAELVKAVTKSGRDDPLSAYDIDVEEDGEAIHLYLSMLESAAAS